MVTKSQAGIDQREPILTGYSGRISAILALGWMAALLGRQAISPLLPAIIEGLQISPPQAGFAFTTMMGLYSISQFPGGKLSDNLSRTTILGVGIGTMIAGFAILIITFDYLGLLAGVACVGAGAGLFFSPSRALLSELYVKRRGQVLGLHAAAGMVGGVLASVSAATMLLYFTWRSAFVIPILLLFVVLILLHHWSREPYDFHPIKFGLKGTSKRLFGSRRTWWLVLGYSLFEFTIQSYIGFLPTLLQIEKTLSPTLASGGFGIVYLTGVIVSPSAGRLSDLLSRDLIILGSLIMGAVGLVVLLLGQSPSLIFTGVILSSVGFWSFVPSIQAHLLDILSKDSLGGDFGFLKAIYTSIGSLGPAYVGLLAQHASYSSAYAGLIIIMVTSAVLLFFATHDT